MSALTAFGERIFPKEKIRQLILQRVRKRRGNVPLPFELEYRHIFVVPTAFGFGFGIMLILMALGGLNFSNNMALLLVFILAAVAQLTTVLAYRNLVGLSVEDVSASPVFCGEHAHFHVYVKNPEDRPRLTIQGGIHATQDCIDIARQSTTKLIIKQTTEHRGWSQIQAFRLETRYPLGMFRAWTWLFPVSRCLVYPMPAKKPPPLPKTGDGPASKARQGEGEQVHGLRQYRQGDSPRRIAWRTSARHDSLFTREMEIPIDNACHISWNALPGTNIEDRLSILTAWVLLADHRQIPYSLDIPGATVSAGQNTEHRDRCLELLALYGI
ncbi:MAG: hypothetical protein ACI9CB_002519 [Rhodothermales bacterium]|jgi:uncharacterized protein (DUF58 family)